MNDKPNGNGREKMIDKIRKLLALAGSANENEAGAAAEKAQELLAEYNITLSEVHTDKGDGGDASISIEVGGITSSYPWRRSIGAAVGALYFCKYFYTTTHNEKGARVDQHSFVGAAHNTQVAVMMFRYLDETIDQLAKDGALKYPPAQRSPYRTSFRAAAAMRVGTRIAQRIIDAKAGNVKTSTGTNLPALLDMYEKSNQRNADYIAAKVGKLRTAPSRLNPNLHSGGYHDGVAAGNRVGLDQQVGGKGKAALLR